MVANHSRTIGLGERLSPRDGVLKEACPYYRFGVTTLQGKPDLASPRPIVRLKEWCQHPKSKHDWITDKVPCGGVTERCVIPSEER
jgi:hypothetical protein